VVGTAGPIHQACLATFLTTPDPLTHRLAGDGESAGRFPQAPALLPGVHDPKSQDHFALLVGELAGFDESERRQGGMPPRTHTPGSSGKLEKEMLWNLEFQLLES